MASNREVSVKVMEIVNSYVKFLSVKVKKYTWLFFLQNSAFHSRLETEYGLDSSI